MKTTKILPTAAAAATLLALTTGCAQLTTAKSTAVQVAAKAVALYCKAPESARRVNRALVDRAIAPNKMSVECAK